MELASRFSSCGRKPTTKSSRISNHQLTPVEPLHLLQLEADELGSEDAQRKGAQGNQIPQGLAPLACKGMDRHQHDVAGLGVGKDLAAEEISINVLQTARYGEKKGGDEGFGHLSVMFERWHKSFLLISRITPCHTITQNWRFVKNCGIFFINNDDSGRVSQEARCFAMRRRLWYNIANAIL